MFREAEEGPIRSDAYIDALLRSHARLPIPLSDPTSAPPAGVRHVIRLLERGLPRFHPSFLFEERLAQQLREAHENPAAAPVVIDRRLLVGGALASGFSLAGAAAMLAWRKRHEWVRRA